MNLFGLTFRFVDTSDRVKRAADDATFRNLGHAAAALRKDAIDSIKNEPGPSQPGTPPHTHTARITKKGKVRKGQSQRAITFDATKTDAVIGFRESVVGLSMHAHEFGDTFHGESFPERPTMAPALDRIAPRFGDSFAGAITGG